MGTFLAGQQHRAQPRIRAGPRPEPDSIPLPNLSRVEAADTVVAVLDGSLTYAAATEILQKELRGRRLRVRGRRVVIEDVAMSYLGRNRVALEVRVSGAAIGRLHLVGTPVYDAARDAITVPDLDYDVQTSNLLVHGITWLAGGKLRNELRKGSRIVSNEFDMGDWAPDKTVIVRSRERNYRLMLWTVR